MMLTPTMSETLVSLASLRNEIMMLVEPTRFDTSVMNDVAIVNK